MSNVTPEDLVRTVIAADDLRRKARGLPSTRAALALGQKGRSHRAHFRRTLFNLLGATYRASHDVLPTFSFGARLVQWVNSAMGAYTARANPESAGAALKRRSRLPSG